ncbi:MAG: hypothetical protein MPJ24_11180, partial [Pirellulaceae bacterium]|nr:hypothetical protein [Pirellulaceae bacterium]
SPNSRPLIEYPLFRLPEARAVRNRLIPQPPWPHRLALMTPSVNMLSYLPILLAEQKNHLFYPHFFNQQ